MWQINTLNFDACPTDHLCQGGALILEKRYGMCQGHDPLFSGQWALPSLPIYHQCTAHVPPFSFLEKFCIFSLFLAKITALKMQISQIFVPMTPHFSRKICSLDPIFGNPCGIHSPKKFSALPDLRISHNAPWVDTIQEHQISYQLRIQEKYKYTHTGLQSKCITLYMPGDMCTLICLISIARSKYTVSYQRGIGQV